MKVPERTDLADGSCELTYDEGNGWLRATWVGYIDPHESYAGASRYLDAMQTFHCPYLLNDNSELRGPWFDSVDWLCHVWAPQAARMGLRCIAHVSQYHDLLQEAAVLGTQSFGEAIEIQIFDAVPAAEAWLQAQQQDAQSHHGQRRRVG